MKLSPSATYVVIAGCCQGRCRTCPGATAPRSPPASRRRVSRGSTISSMNPCCAATAGRQVLARRTRPPAGRARPRGRRRRRARAGAPRRPPAWAPMIADLGARPGEREVRAEVLRVHRDVGAAVGLAQDDGHASARSASANACSSLAPWRITPAPPAWCRAGSRACPRARRAAARTRCRCARSGPPSAPPSASITPPRYQGWLAITPTGRPSMRAKRGDHVARPALGHLEHARRRPPARDHLAHVVDLARRRRARRAAGSPPAPAAGGAIGGARRRAAAGRRAASRTSSTAARSSAATNWQTPLASARAARRARRVDVLAHHLATTTRAGQEHRRLLGHHDEVGQRRRVRAAARRDAGDHRDLRHAAGQPHVAAEDAPVAGQRGDAVVHPRAARGDEADHRRAARARRARITRRIVVRVRLAERAAGERLVLRVAEHRPPGDRPGRRRPRRRPARVRVDRRRGEHGRADHVQRPGSQSARAGPSGVERLRGSATIARACVQRERSLGLQAEHGVVPAEAERVRDRRSRAPSPFGSGRASRGT